MNLTDNEIIKALECHIKRQCWNDCPNATEERQLLSRPCSSMIAEDALDLINRKQAVNELQAKEIVELKIKVEQQKADIDFYKERSSKYEAQVAVLLEQTHQQKEEIERLKYISYLQMLNRQMIEQMEHEERMRKALSEIDKELLKYYDKKGGANG
jgi:TolA-binding protein